MEIEAELAIILSVLLHVTWNLLARNDRKEVNIIWWGIGAYVVIFTP